MYNNQNNDRNDRYRQQRASLPQMNESIRFSSFVLIDENGTNLGELIKNEALRLADEKKLDVVIISPNANPPIAKLMDYRRHLYEQKRKKRESKKNQTVIRIKEINVKPTIGQHDLTWRANNAVKWLDEGFHVKFTVKAFNRMITRDEIIKNLFNTFMNLIGEHGEIERNFSRTAANAYEASIIPNKNYKSKVKEDVNAELKKDNEEIKENQNA